MQHFREIATDQIFNFDDDVIVQGEDGNYSFFMSDGTPLLSAPSGMERLDGPVQQDPPHYVPQQVTRAQGKASLIVAGLWQDVLNVVEAIEDPVEKALAEVGLNDATHWERSSPMLNMLATALGLSEEDLDNLFIQAYQIRI